MSEAIFRTEIFVRGMRGLMRKEIWIAILSSLMCVPCAFAFGPSESITFRPGGNVSLLSSVQQIEWDIHEAGGVKNAAKWSFSPGLVLRYAFHFQFIRGIGGVVGTDVAFYHDWSDVGGNDAMGCGGRGFRAGPSFSFPSMTFGVVKSFSEAQRFVLMGQYTGTTFPWMKTCLNDGSEQLLAAIPHSAAILGQLDLFSEGNTAFSVALGYRFLSIQCVGIRSVCTFGSQKTSALEKLDIAAKGALLQLGMTWQTSTEGDR